MPPATHTTTRPLILVLCLQVKILSQQSEYGLADIENSWCFKLFKEVWNVEIHAPGRAISTVIAHAPNMIFTNLIPTPFTPDNLRQACGEDMAAVIRVVREFHSLPPAQ